MKERPIIFTTEMVKAILEGRKTQTRRVAKLPANIQVNSSGVYTLDWDEENECRWRRDYYCPYGQVGDRLWVRETWSVSDGTLTQYYIYKADGQPHPDVVDSAGHRSKGKWRSSLFMPYRASRITLEITDIRAERLQEIIGKDVGAEGIRRRPLTDITYVGDAVLFARQDFIKLWDSLNAKRGYSWDSNPWVWVISFKRLPEEK